MAARKEISRRKTALLEELREAHRSGLLAPGDAAPPVRDLALRHELSVGVVIQQLQILEQEGLFYTVPRTGTFVGRPQGAPEFYLFIVRPQAVGEKEIAMGFEEEVTRRGATALIISRDQALEKLKGDLLPPISGVLYYAEKFDSSERKLLSERNPNRLVAEVKFDPPTQEDEKADRVYFDNVNGGRYAAQHLVQAGHKRIAFLGLHTDDNFLNYEWSADRLQGWHTALTTNGLPTEGLSFLPLKPIKRLVPESNDILREAAHRLLRQAKATAVVCANDAAAFQLMEACRESQLPLTQWPAIVSFDDTLPFEQNLLTSFRLPWDEIGRVAARLLWERAHGQLTGKPTCRLVPMRIIPRLSCRANWTLAQSLQPVL